MEEKKMNIMNEMGVIFTSLVIIYFIYRAYAYLGDLDSCNCAPQPIVDNLKTIELIYLCVSLTAVVFNVIYLIFNLNFANFINKNNYLIGILILYIIFMFGLYFYYIFNVIEFKKTLKPSCECTNQWQNDIIYIHALYMSLPILLSFLSTLFNFKVNISVLMFIIIAIVAIYFYEQYILKKGKTTESMKSMLGNYSDMVYQPNIYSDSSTPFNTNNGIEPSKPSYGVFSPNVGQPLQQYHQKKPDEYPQIENDLIIQTPLSSHESIVKEYRKKMPNLILS